MDSCRTLIQIRFSSIEQFAPYRESIRSVFRTLGEREATLFFVALNEAVNNALIPGSIGDSDEGVELSIRDGDDRLCAIIRSCGRGFCNDLKLDPDVFDDGFRESGRGVQIILHIADECAIGESGCVMSLSMNKNGVVSTKSGE